MQDPLSVIAPHFEDVRALIVLSEVFREDLHLEDAKVRGARRYHIVITVVFYPVEAKF
jgi:hypothetical protein